MKGVIDAVKDIYEGLHENQETKSALVELKTQIATEIVDQVEKQSPELFLSVGKDLIVDYLVADGLFDKIKDTMMGMTVMKISAFSEKFRYLREKIGKVSTQEELEGLKDQIIKDLHAEGSPTASQGSHRSSQEAKNENMDSSSSVFSHEGEHLEAQAQEKSLHLMRQYEQLKGEEKPDFQPYAYALQRYEKMKSELGNTKYLTIVDYSKSNTTNRFFVINMEKGEVEYAVPVGHGKKSGKEFATDFSDVFGSHQSSLGFYRTPASITKAHTKSWRGLLLQGIEDSNDQAQSRGIYIHPGTVAGSEGCFTLPRDANSIMKALKGDSLLFAYYPDKQYLASSNLIDRDLDIHDTALG